VRHLGEVHHDRAPGDIPSERDLERVGRSLGLDRLQHAAERDELPVPVGHLDSDRRAARDRGKDPDVRRSHGICDVLGEGGHARHLHACPELELESGNRRSHRVPDQVRLDAVAGEGALEHTPTLLDPLAIEILFLAPLEELQRRELPRARCGGDRQAELLGLCCDGRGAERAFTRRLGADDRRICQLPAIFTCGSLGNFPAAASLICVRGSREHRHVTCPGRRRSAVDRPDVETVRISFHHPDGRRPVLERLDAHRCDPVAQEPARPSRSGRKPTADHANDGEQGHPQQSADRRDRDGTEHDGRPGRSDDPGEPTPDAGSGDATRTPELAPCRRGPR
jgi:hypothetical protein